MSYGSTPKPGMRRSGGGMIFLIVLAIGAFMIFSNAGQVRNQPGQPGQKGYDPGDILGSTNDDELERQRQDILGGGGDFESRPMPSGSNANRSGDWQMEDAGAKQTSNPNSRNSTTTKGDWSIEEVDSKQDRDSQFKFSNPEPAKDGTPESGGDWSIEDGGTKNKKTEKGDWSIEETNSDKDK